MNGWSLGLPAAAKFLIIHMKLITLFLFSVSTLLAAEPPQTQPTVRQGRLLEFDGKRAEFLIQTNRRIAVTFVDVAGKSIPAGECSMVMTINSKPIILEAKTDGFISKEPLENKGSVPVVLQLRASSTAKPVNFRLTTNTTFCSGCSRQEYACTCSH